MATKEKIVAVVAMLCEAFNRKPTPATYKAYEIALSDVDDELVTSAGNVALTSSREFMPTPGQLREMAVTGGSATSSGPSVPGWNSIGRLSERVRTIA
jgi:hypothetical protein